MQRVETNREGLVSNDRDIYLDDKHDEDEKDRQSLSVVGNRRPHQVHHEARESHLMDRPRARESQT